MTKLDHQQKMRRMAPKMVTTAPMRIPNKFDMNITSLRISIDRENYQRMKNKSRLIFQR
jgi:hypothetical protein